MLNDIKDRKKVYKFLNSFHKGMIEHDKSTSKVIVDFGVTTKQLKNLVDNKTEHYIGAQAVNLKQIFIKILERSLESIHLTAVEKQNIEVEDFLSLSRKMSIDESLVSKAENIHMEFTHLDEFERLKARS